MNGPCTFGKAAPYIDPSRRLDPIIHELRKARIESGVSQRIMATKIGVGLDTYKKWEQGVIFPTYFNLTVWAQVLNRKIVLA